MKKIEPEARLHPSDPAALAKARDPKNVARFKHDNGDWRDTSWPRRQLVFTCATPGCKVEGIPYEVSTPENVDGVIRSECGQCNKTHEDIKEKV
jgi:hypothetical protein